MLNITYMYMYMYQSFCQFPPIPHLIFPYFLFVFMTYCMVKSEFIVFHLGIGSYDSIKQALLHYTGLKEGPSAHATAR